MGPNLFLNGQAAIMHNDGFLPPLNISGLPRTIEPPTLCDKLIVLSSLLLALRDQSHLIHLNAQGADFISVHEWLKDRYEEHAEQFDAVAELVRIHGKMLPNSITELRNCLPVFDDEACLCSYRNNIKTLSAMTNGLEKTAIDERAIDVADAMIDLTRSAGKTAWFLESIMAGHS